MVSPALTNFSTMCNNTFNIKVVEGNEFPIILRLQALSYSAVPPIAEPIDYTKLTDCVFKVGGVQYDIEITEDGVRAIMPATLALGDYNVEFTAKYEDSDIRAAYLRAITIVKWNEQSNAGECLLGSPVMLPAAIVIGTLTDAELEELKEEMREKNAQLAQAIEDEQAAKAEWERKAAELDDVAQQSTLTRGVQDIREDISHINIDTSNLAKQGTNPNATLTEVQTAAEAAKTAAEALPTLQEIVGGVINETTILPNLEGYTFSAGFTPHGAGDVLINRKILYSIDDDKVEELNGTLYDVGLGSLEYVRLRKATTLKVNYFARQMSSLKALICDELTGIENYYGFVYDSPLLEMVALPKVSSINTISQFANCPRLINLIIGGGFISSFSLQYWSPTEALRSDTNSLVKSGETFANNLEKLLYNIREHIAANLINRTEQTSLTLTMSAAVKAAINGDTATANAFADKNWIIA